MSPIADPKAWADKGGQLSRLYLLSRLDSFADRNFELMYEFSPVEMMYRFDARAAIERGNGRSEQSNYAKLVCNPEQIETPIELIPVAQKVFGKDKVQSWIDMYAEPLEKHMAASPMTQWSATTLLGCTQISITGSSVQEN